jgi:hypothetical protein
MNCNPKLNTKTKKGLTDIFYFHLEILNYEETYPKIIYFRFKIYCNKIYYNRDFNKFILFNMHDFKFTPYSMSPIPYRLISDIKSLLILTIILFVEYIKAKNDIVYHIYTLR